MIDDYFSSKKKNIKNLHPTRKTFNNNTLVYAHIIIQVKFIYDLVGQIFVNINKYV